MNPLSGVIGDAGRMYRAHAAHLLTIAFLVYVVAAVLQALFTGLLGVIGALIGAAIGIVAAFLLQAALVKAVEDVLDGRADLSVSDTLKSATPFIGRVGVASILAGIAIAIGLVLFILPGLFLLTIWCLVVPVIVLETLGVGAAFSRSQQLVKGHFWQVFGTIVLVFLLLIVANIVISLLLSPLPDVAQGFLASVISGTLVAPFTALVLTLGYLRLRNLSGRPGPGAGYRPA